mmetsp:Transcript_43119/g.88232  ORF Transcript_43119/g.88232 Transcript_43119/m.88232 type:complete len:221 (-) Transcript_43119:261-923(-)
MLPPRVARSHEGSQAPMKRRNHQGSQPPRVAGSHEGSRAHMRPKPSALLMAVMRQRRSLSTSLYSGRRRWLKQVCAVGRRSESGPLRLITNVMLPSPLIGDLSLPVQKKSSFFFSCSDMAWTTDQKLLMTGWSRVYPSSVDVISWRAWKSRLGLPHISSSSSSGMNMRRAGPPHTWWKPSAKAANCCWMLSSSRYLTYRSTYSCRLSAVTLMLSPPGLSG